MPAKIAVVKNRVMTMMSHLLSALATERGLTDQKNC